MAAGRLFFPPRLAPAGREGGPQGRTPGRRGNTKEGTRAEPGPITPTETISSREEEEEEEDKDSQIPAPFKCGPRERRS